MFTDEKAIPKVDLSCMKLLAIGGSYVSQDKKSRIDRILSEHGMKYDSTIGYGLSEAGGACFLTEPGVNIDTLGKPLPGIKVLLLDEDDGKFYRPEDGKRRGVLMIATPSLSSGRIDDTVYFEHTVIDGEPYLNTKDLVEAGEDGSLKIVGRANKFFTNDAGKRFEHDNGFARSDSVRQKLDDFGFKDWNERLTFVANHPDIDLRMIHREQVEQIMTRRAH